MLKRLIIPDTHSPFEDKRAWKLLLRVAPLCQAAVILGDFADCYRVSRHSKSPARAHTFKTEIDQTNDRLNELESIFGKNVDFIEGNHEYRLERYLNDKAPELYGLISMRKELRIDERGWSWTPYFDHIKRGKIYYTHDVNGYSGRDAHLKSRATYESNVIIGHCHRMLYSVVGNQRNEKHIAASFGWLGDATQVDYMHRAAVQRDWTLGFGVVTETSKLSLVQPVPIVNYQCVVDGQFFRG